MRLDDPARVLHDDSPISEVDQAILYCLDTPELDPRIRSAFIDALLDKPKRREVRVLTSPETR